MVNFDVTMMAVVIGIAAGLLLCGAFVLRKYVFHRYGAEVRQYTRTIFQARAKAVDDLVQGIFADCTVALPPVHSTSAARMSDDADTTRGTADIIPQLALEVIGDLFRETCDETNADTVPLCDLSSLRQALNTNTRVLDFCGRVCEHAYTVAETRLAKDGRAYLFRNAAEATEAPQPAITCCCQPLTCCCSIESSLLTENYTLVLYGMAHRMCCGRNEIEHHDSRGGSEASVHIPVGPESTSAYGPGPRTVRLLDMAGCVGRKLVELTGHSRNLVHAKPGGGFLIDPSPCVYTPEETEVIVRGTFHRHADDDLSYSPSGTPRDGAGVEMRSTSAPLPLVTARLDEAVFSSKRLRDDLWIFFSNLQVVARTAPRLKSTLLIESMETMRKFDGAVKQLCVDASEFVAHEAASEWQRRLFTKMKRLVKAYRSDVLKTSKSDLSVHLSISGIGTTPEAQYKVAATVLGELLKQFFSELAQWSTVSVPVSKDCRQKCPCHACIPSFRKLVQSIPLGSDGIQKFLTQRLRAATVMHMLPEQHRLQARAELAPLRRALVDLMLPQSTSIEAAVVNAELDSHRDAVICRAIRDTVEEAEVYIDEVISRVEVDTAEKTLTNEAGTTLKQLLNLVLTHAQPVIEVVSRHVDLAVRCITVTQSLCAAARLHQPTGELYKRAYQLFVEYINHGEAANRIVTDLEAKAHDAARGADEHHVRFSVDGFRIGSARFDSFPFDAALTCFHGHHRTRPESPRLPQLPTPVV